MTIDAKVEAAFATVIAGLPELAAFIAAYQVADLSEALRVEEVPIALKHSEGIQARPLIVVECYNSEEAPAGTGNFWCDVRVHVISESDQMEPFDGMSARHNALAKAVLEDGLKVDNLGVLLSAAVHDFFVYPGCSANDGDGMGEDAVMDGGVDPSVRGRNFVSGNLWRIFCCGADLVTA